LGGQPRFTLSDVRDPVLTNLELMRRFYALWNTGGVEGMLEHVLAPEVVFYDDPEALETGIFRGAEEVAARVGAIMEGLGHFQFEVRSLEERGDYVLAALVLSIKGPSSGVALAVSQSHVCRLGNGRMREIRAYRDADQARQEYERLSTQRA
jgi:ketosteroid isomerase-like protein